MATLNLRLDHSYTDLTGKDGCTPPSGVIAESPVVAARYDAVLLIPTTDRTITLPADITTVGRVVVYNLDGTNYVSIGTDGSQYDFIIPAGEWFQGMLNNTALHLKAHTAACYVRVMVYNKP